jgi:glyoxylase-like metal-dependent hydrolase (beta-lactamase superfamily II)
MRDTPVVAPGIRSIPLSTPWAVGRVVVYLVDDDPLTLIDTGQRTPEALADLEEGLRAAGRRVEDLERIIVTHQHLDHSGLAADLVERSGAELCALDSLADWFETYPRSLHAEDTFALDTLRRHGVVTDGVAHTAQRGPDDLAAPAFVTQRLHDGDVLGFADRELRVLHRPGHSPHDTVFHDEARGTVFGGDHVLNWPTTAIMGPPLTAGVRNGRTRAFASYVASLRATSELDVETILPGHGEPVLDHRETIAERMRRYERLTEETAAAVTSEPRTAIAIAAGLRGDIAEATAFFVLCEVLGHLDELVDAGRVVELIDPDGVSRFAAS